MVIETSSMTSLTSWVTAEVPSPTNRPEPKIAINASTSQGSALTATSPPSAHDKTTAITTSVSPSSSQDVSLPMSGPSTLEIALISASLVLGFVFLLVGCFFMRRAAHRREASTKVPITDTPPGSSKASTVYVTSPGSVRSWDPQNSFESISLNFSRQVEDRYPLVNESTTWPNNDSQARKDNRKNNKRRYRESNHPTQRMLWRSAIQKKRSSSLGPQVLEESRTALATVTEDIQRFPQRSSSALKSPIPSILKRPHTPTPSIRIDQSTETTQFDRLATAIQTILPKAPESVYRPKFAPRIPEPARKKMSVRFGVDQIREFGRTPVASRSGSVGSGVT